MTKENGYIWITDEVDSSSFSMVTPQWNRSWCYPSRHDANKCKDSIKNERIIQVAVAVNGSLAENQINNQIIDDECCNLPVVCPCYLGPRCPSNKKCSNNIKNEKILQVAVAVDSSEAQNSIDSFILNDQCCANGGVQPQASNNSTSVKGEKNVVNKQYKLNSLDGDFNLLISKDGEISINGLKVEEAEDEEVVLEKE